MSEITGLTGDFDGMYFMQGPAKEIDPTAEPNFAWGGEGWDYEPELVVCASCQEPMVFGEDVKRNGCPNCGKRAFSL